jgi:hypothetical protein
MTGDRYLGLTTVPPRKRSPAKPRVRTKISKPQPRLLEHVRYGEGKLVWVRQLDSGDCVVSVKFGDGTERVLQLRQQYWISDIASLIPALTPTPKPLKHKPTASHADDDLSANDEGEQESWDGGADEAA